MTTHKEQFRDRAQFAGKRARQEYEDNWLFRLFSNLVIVGLFAALCYVAWINVAPYVLLVKMLGNGPNWIEGLPLIGWIVQAWGSFVSTIVGVLIWVLVQSLQCLWLLIGLDKRALRNAATEAESGRFHLPETADRRTKAIEQKARRIPYFFIRWGGLLSLGAYAFDLMVGLSLYPPARSFDRFWFALSAGMWSAIDLGNVIKLLLMLFAFEFVLVLFLVVLQWLRTRNAEPAAA